MSLIIYSEDMLIQLPMPRLEDRLAVMRCCHGEDEILFCVCVWQLLSSSSPPPLVVAMVALVAWLYLVVVSGSVRDEGRRTADCGSIVSVVQGAMML